MEGFIIIIKATFVVVGGILINKTTQVKKFDWVERNLRILWFTYFFGIGICILSDAYAWREFMKLNKQFSNSSFLLQIAIIFVIGGLIFCGLWILAGRLSPDEIIQKPEAPPDITATPPSKIPTPEEIAKALKKEFAPRIKNSKMPVHPPSTNKAKREVVIRSLDQFIPGFGSRLKVGIPGYFELSSDPSPGNPYSGSLVKTHENLGSHYYTSIRMGPLDNIGTMDFGGDVIICVDRGWNIFFIWETEYMQEGWYPIKINTQKHPNTNTLGIYQKGRSVAIYVNNELIGEYTKLKDPVSKPITVSMKANPATGGKIHFESFAIWEY